MKKGPQLSSMSSQNSPASSAHISTAPIFTLSHTGDVVLTFVYPKCLAEQPWVNRKRHKSSKRPAFHIRLPSNYLRVCGGYFSTLCDPDKFQEGSSAAAQLQDLQAKHEGKSLEETLASSSLEDLPHIEVEFPPLTVASEPELEHTLKTFMLCRILDSPVGNQLDFDVEGENWLKSSIICNLIILTDRFESSSLLERIHKETTFEEKVFSMIYKATSSKREQNLRQAIFSTHRLSTNVLEGSHAIKRETLRELTSRLIIRGSKEWYNPPSEIPGIDREIWWEIPDGIEAEMKYRHQCIIDTIDSLQAHFLRAYGAYIPGDPSTSSRPRSLQCRRMYENSRACDSFHLGEIIRFFSQRIKTISIVSALSDVATNSDYENDTDDGGDQGKVKVNDIKAILASLRSVPEYQIDDNHVGCGVRRQLVPAVNAIESCLGYCGLCLAEFTPSSNPPDGWRVLETIRDKKSLENYHVNVSTNGKVISTPFPAGNLCNCTPRAACAQVFFTAKNRIRWPGWSDS